MTEFRCFANYPRLAQSHCISSADPRFAPPSPPSSPAPGPLCSLSFPLPPSLVLLPRQGQDLSPPRVILPELPLFRASTSFARITVSRPVTRNGH